MRLNAIQTLIILLAITVGTVITRFLPPILFPHGKPLPKFLPELCTLLPPAMMGLLLVYSLRTVSFASAGQWLPECIAIAVTAGLHLWRRNSLLSIAGGTITYMPVSYTHLVGLSGTGKIPEIRRCGWPTAACAGW